MVAANKNATQRARRDAASDRSVIPQLPRSVQIVSIGVATPEAPSAEGGLQRPVSYTHLRAHETSAHR
eukprot:12335381-Alexandrium_andersonii.AAC.1